MILGIDPSLRRTGLALIDENGRWIDWATIETKPRSCALEAFDQIREEAEFWFRVWSSPRSVRAEAYSPGARSHSAAVAMAVSHCAIRATFDQVVWTPAEDGKRRLTGNPNASKDEMVSAGFPKAPEFTPRGFRSEKLSKLRKEAVCDAYGIALCGLPAEG